VYYIQWIKQTTIFICIALILISLITAVLLSKRFNRVIQNITDRFKSLGVAFQSSSKMDEFGMIRHYLDTLHSMNVNLEKQVKETFPFVKADFLQSLLTKQLNVDDFEEKLSFYEVPTQSSHFTVLCLELVDLRGGTVKDVSLFIYAVSNIVEEIARDLNAGSMIVRMNSDQVAVIINHGTQNQSKEELQDEVFQIAQEIHKVVEKLLKITLTIGIGNSYKDVKELHHSYKEALKALQHQLIEGSGKVIFIGDLISESSFYMYPTEHEDLIIKYMKLGNLEKVKESLDEFSAIIRRQEQATYAYGHQSFVQLLAATLRTLCELDPQEGPKLFTYNVYQHMTSMKTIDQIVDWLNNEIYPVITQHLVKRRNQGDYAIIEKVLNYIHQHYDEDLSLPMMAEEVSVSVSHFSTMFKEEVGMTFTEYLIAYRVEKAKEFLAITDMKVSEISNRLRYNNPQNFIRVFKKITGTTPGEYRTQQKDKIS
jgi:two-component system response regulator YesN